MRLSSALNGAENCCLSSRAVGGTLPAPGLPVTLTPLARKASVRSLAAYVAGSFTRLPSSRLSLPERADSGPHSSSRPGFQDGPLRFLSNQLSYPRTRPLTSVSYTHLTLPTNREV